MNRPPADVGGHPPTGPDPTTQTKAGDERMAENDIETTVLEQAQGILDRQGLTLDDDFFDVGGDSVVGMHFVGRVGRMLGLPIRTTLLFANPVLRDFVTEVAAVQKRHAEIGEGT